MFCSGLIVQRLVCSCCSQVFFFLETGTALANFIEFGNIPDEKLVLITSLRALGSSFLKSLSIPLGIMLGPQALSVLIVVIISSISSLQEGLTKKKFSFGLHR